jgi:hypothetical protein
MRSRVLLRVGLLASVVASCAGVVYGACTLDEDKCWDNEYADGCLGIPQGVCTVMAPDWTIKILPLSRYRICVNTSPLYEKKCCIDSAIQEKCASAKNYPTQLDCGNDLNGVNANVQTPKHSPNSDPCGLFV